jgi:predicted transcriptional regulator
MENKLKGRHKLTDADVESLRDSYKNSGMSQETLAKVYGVSQAQISRIVKGLQRKTTSVEVQS